MSDWKAPTRLDDRLARRAAALRESKGMFAGLPQDVVEPLKAERCPGPAARRCGRKVSPMMLRDVSRVDPAITGGAPFLCDACVEALHASEQLGREELARLQGAPRDFLTRLRAKLDANPDGRGRLRR